MENLNTKMSQVKISETEAQNIDYDATNAHLNIAKNPEELFRQVVTAQPSGICYKEHTMVVKVGERLRRIN